MQVQASMSGSIWKLQVKEGDMVKSGDVVIILESMKMEIPIEAPKDGKVTKVNIAEGDFVQESDVVIEIE